MRYDIIKKWIEVLICEHFSFPSFHREVVTPGGDLKFYLIEMARQ